VGTFTVLGDAELAQLADAFRLGVVLEHRAIAAGTINSNYELVTERGRFFIRVNEGKSEQDVAWEARLVGALAERGVVTPPPLAAQDGRPYAPIAGKWASAFAWRDGHHLVDVTPAHAEQFGAALADLHRAGLELPVEWRRTSIYDHDHLVPRFARIAATRDPDLARAIDVLRDELAIASGAVAERARATHGIIHGDLFRDNVLWDAGRITAILDFEQASGGSLAYDIAVCINDWCWREGNPPNADSMTIGGEPRFDLAEALLRGYQAVRPLTIGAREALPVEIRAAAMRFTITRITDVYLAKVPNPEKDFRAFLARVEAWRGPSLGQLTSTV
jgi:homoserine kinase type II